MSLRLSITEAALAERCARQFALAREGIGFASGSLAGGAAIGTAAHLVLAEFVRRGAETPALEAELARGVCDPALLQQAVWNVLYSFLFDQAGAFAARRSIDELIALAGICRSLAAFLATLLLRTRRAGISGRAAMAAAFESSERDVSWLSSDGGVELSGRIDLLCRDPQSRESYVVDLKTGFVDAAAEAQVRMYSLALAREGIAAAPALLHVANRAVDEKEGELRLVKVVLPDDEGARLSHRLSVLREIALGAATPPAATDPALCRSCPVQASCWQRWGPTLDRATATLVASQSSGSQSSGSQSSAAPSPAAPVATPSLSSAILEDARRLERILRVRGVPVAALDPANAIVGPSVVRFRVKLREGGTLARIERAADDLQRDMNWPAPPLISNDGLFVAIDAPRPDREALPWSLAPKLEGLVVPVGLTLQRSLLELDLAEAPHVLVAGATGSGKTIFLESLLIALLERSATSPSELVVVDPKLVDFAPFDRCALHQPVVTDSYEAVQLLAELAGSELPRRTERLKKLGVNHRRLVPAGEAPMLPRVVVIDEFTDLVQSLRDKKAREAFLESVQRLLQKARFAGIHLVIATQRPSVDALPGSLKVNLDVRIAFRLPDATNSRIVLDESGAERLFGKGDLLMRRLGATTRAQGFLVERGEIDRLSR